VISRPRAAQAEFGNAHGAHIKERTIMLHYSLVFLVVAIIAGVLGFGGIAGNAAWIAKILFLVFLVAWVISLLTGRRTPS
tara:strand:- start:4538 stop:4777 length:240 start_codon:yes stop_codon:yes gene_type:complete